GLYRAGERRPRTELLVRALVSGHRALAWRAGRLLADTEPVAVAATGEAIRSLFAVQVAKENYLLLPALAASRVDLLALLGSAEHMAAS
ncbi:MAG: hypothetical protein ACRDOH_19115, partial [Streptosporangiaceae bacterium]